MSNETAVENAKAWFADMEANGLIEWLPDSGWTTSPEVVAGKKCRQRGCRRPAVAALRRSNGWWCYCDEPEHLYGRRIENGVVLHWRVKRGDEVAK